MLPSFCRRRHRRLPDLSALLRRGFISGLSGLMALSARAQPAAATVFSTANSPLPDDAVSALCYDAARARLWVGTDYGLARLDLAAPGAPVWTIYRAAPGGLPNDAIRALALADSTGRPGRTGGAVWVGTFSGGLARLDVAANTWQVWTAATSPLPLDHVRALAPTPDGGVWVGTAGGLAYRAAAGGWRVFTPFNSVLPSGNVAALVRDAVDSTLWAGTVNGGLVRWRRGALRAYSFRTDNLPDNTVLALALDSVRRPVLGTAAAGLVRYLTDSTWAAYGPRTSANPAATVLALAQDSAGRRWLGSAEHGLVAWDRGRWTAFAFGSAAGLPDSSVRAVVVGAGGELWLGLRSGGLARWRPGPLTSNSLGEEAAALTVWPNPVRAGQVARVGRLRPETGAATATVFDAYGRLLWQVRAATGATEMALPRLLPGLYAVRVARNHRIRTVKLLVTGD